MLSARLSMFAAFIVVNVLLIGCSSQHSPESRVDSAASPPASEDAASAPASGEVISGTIKEVNPRSGEVVIQTSDGKEHRVHAESHSAIHSIAESGKEIGKGAEHLGKAAGAAAVEGSHAVVHYTVVGGKKVIEAAHVAEKKTVQTTRGVIQAIDHYARKVTVKTADGAQQVFHVTQEALIGTGRGVAKFGQRTGHGLAEGSTVVVEHTEQAGQKVAHFFQHLGGSNETSASAN